MGGSMNKDEKKRMMDIMIDYYFTVVNNEKKEYLLWSYMDTKEQVYIRSRLYARGIDIEEFFKYFKGVRNDATKRMV